MNIQKLFLFFFLYTLIGCQAKYQVANSTQLEIIQTENLIFLKDVNSSFLKQIKYNDKLIKFIASSETRIDILLLEKIYEDCLNLFELYENSKISLEVLFEKIDTREEKLIDSMIFEIIDYSYSYKEKFIELNNLRSSIKIVDSDSTNEKLIVQQRLFRNLLIFNKSFQIVHQFIIDYESDQLYVIPEISQYIDNENDQIEIFVRLYEPISFEEISIFVNKKKVEFKEGKAIVDFSLISESDSMTVIVQRTSRLSGRINQTERKFSIMK